MLKPQDQSQADRSALCTVTFLPENMTVQAEVGSTLLDAALEHGIDLPNECGGNCACTTCHVIIQAGMEHLSPMEQAEADRLETAEGLTSTSRLGCQALLRGGPIIVSIADSPSVS